MTIAPEYELLLDAILPSRSPRADLTDWGPQQWGQALRVAAWHRLSPVLHCHLSERGGAPATVGSALQRAYLANAARTLFIREALRRVTDALAAAGVETILLKGAALIQGAYRDPAQREMLDLDLLVRSSQLAAATAALTALGYRAPSADGPAGASTQLEAEAHHDDALVGEQELVAVELHRHIAIAGEGHGVVSDGFWTRASAGPAGQFLLPAPEDLLLHVCLHFTRSRLGGSYRHRNTGGALAQICDIARIVEGTPPDWSALAATAHAHGIGTRVFLGLFTAATLGAAIPEPALAALRPAGFDARIGRRLVALRVLRDGDHLPPRSVRWMLAPSRDVLSNGWNAEPGATMSLARAYLRRAWAHAPEARTALRRPMDVVHDRRLNAQLLALEDRA